jgi:hypothetical protein
VVGFRTGPEWRVLLWPFLLGGKGNGRVRVDREEPGYLGFGRSAIDHRRLGGSLADWRHGKAGCCCDPVRLFVVFAYGFIDGFGGAEALGRSRCGERE